jgi:hypothetical protein
MIDDYIVTDREGRKHTVRALSMADSEWRAQHRAHIDLRVPLKTVLEQRLELLDQACDAETPGTPTYDEMAGRYEECKAILQIVNFTVGSCT